MVEDVEQRGGAIVETVGTARVAGDAREQCVHVARTHRPTRSVRGRWDDAYARHVTTVEAMRNVWDTIDAVGGTP